MKGHAATVLFVVIAVTISLVVCEKKKWLPHEYPNPLKDLEECGRGQTSYVCDPNALLDSRDASRLDALIRRTRNQTSCLCSDHYCNNLNARGTKIGVAVVREMMTEEEARGEATPKYSLQSKLNDAAKFAQYLDNSWKIGQCEDTAIIFYSAADHVLWTHTGERTSRILTNSYLSEIAMNHRFLFEKGEYFDGLASLINDYGLVLRGTYKSKMMMPEQPREPQALMQNGSGSLAQLGLSLLMIIATLLLHF